MIYRPTSSIRKAMILKHNNQSMRYRAYDAAGDDLYRELMWKSKSKVERARIVKKHKMMAKKARHR